MKPALLEKRISFLFVVEAIEYVLLNWHSILHIWVMSTLVRSIRAL